MNKSLPVRIRLLIMWLSFVFFFLGCGILQVMSLNSVSKILANISQVQLPAVHNMTLVDMMHDGLMGAVYKSLTIGEKSDEATKKAMSEELTEYETNFDLYFKKIDALDIESDTKKLIDSDRPFIQKYVQVGKEIVELSLKGKKEEAEKKLPEFQKAFDDLEIKLGELGEKIAKDSDAKEALGKKVSKDSKNLSIMLIAIGLLLTSAISIYIIKKLSVDLTNTVEVLSQSVHDVQNSSQKLDIMSKKLHESVESQIGSISKSASATEEISAMLRTNTDSIARVKRSSQSANQSAMSGKDKVVVLKEEVTNISKSYDDIESVVSINNGEIEKMVTVISEIAKHTEIINEIVFQTKLLAFNASVEAARAGEAGKGFAVVADEMASLADKSGKASANIAQMLSSSQTLVKDIAQNTKSNISKIIVSGKDKISQGHLAAENCQLQLEEILKIVGELDSDIFNITEAIKEQAAGVDEVNNSMKSLEGSTHETRDISEKSKESSNDLHHQAHSLRVTIQDIRKILGAKKSYSVDPLD